MQYNVVSLYRSVVSRAGISKMNQHGNWVCWMSTGRCCERFNVKKTWHADHAATLLFDFRQLLLLDYFQPSRSHALSPTRDPTRARDCCPYGGDERNTLIRYAHNEHYPHYGHYTMHATHTINRVCTECRVGVTAVAWGNELSHVGPANNIAM